MLLHLKLHLKGLPFYHADKWLETEYGKDLQKKLSGRLIGVYGQRDRTFGASVNSVIIVYTKNNDFSKRADFIYLESYSSHLVRNYVHFMRKDLHPGKWFYLRAPKVFMEKIYPKLTHKLRDFAEIKRGFTTGINDFFYMKDVSAYYEKDYLENPKFFEDWGVNARNEKELKVKNLIYIQNEGGERFIIESSQVKSIVRSPKDIKNYIFNPPDKLFFYCKIPNKFSSAYIKLGEKLGYNNGRTVTSRKLWYQLTDFFQLGI